MTKQCSSCGGFCGNVCQRENVTQPVQEPWNEDEWRRNNWRCSHGWLRGEQCEICNASQEPYDQTALELCNVCGWKTLIPDDCCLNCERAQPEPDVDYWIREATAARQAEMALRRELEAQPVQRQPLTEMDITAIAYSCRNNDAIHYVIAIARAVEAAHGIGGATK